MLTRAKLSGQNGSAMVSALMVMLVMLPLGLALLSIVDTQARDSGRERTRDRAFNLSDSALTSAASNLGRFAWPTSGATAPSNTGATGTAAACGTATYGAALGAATNPGSATAGLQPNLNASFDDAAYTGATWQINVCDDDATGAAPTVWKDALLTKLNYDQNANQKVWVRASATVAGHTRTLAALTTAAQAPALSSKYAVMTGRMNSDLTTTAGTVLSGSLIGDLTSTLLDTDPLIAADPSIATAYPPSSGITAVRCGVLDMSVANTCLSGALAATSSLPLLGDLVTGGNLVQATSLTAASDASVAQLKQQAMNSGTYVASTPGTASQASAPPCVIPAAANSTTIVYIEQVGSGTLGTTTGGVGDQYCQIDLSTSNVAYKALIIGHGRVVLRGNGNSTAIGAGSKNTFSGVVYALNQQRASEMLGDSATAAREVIRIDEGAHVKGGVAADGKSALIGIYPPPLCGKFTVGPVEVDTCVGVAALAILSGLLGHYNPAVQADVSLMNAVKIYTASTLVTGSYRDIAGEVH